MEKTETKKTVLVAEDEYDLCSALQSALETMGNYQVLTATDGEEALKLALEEKPDHIILDIHMPKLNGDEVLQRLRADEWGSTVTITVLTAQSDIDAIASAIEIGGSGTSYLVKSEISLMKLVEHVGTKIGD